jgi:hypothetical protein
MARTSLRIASYLGLAAFALVGTVSNTRVAVSQERSAPTFSKDVVPILQEKCQDCHRPDSIAPMSLLTYEQTRPWAKSIRERVISRNMPPWHLDKTVGIQHFKNDRSLSDQQIDTIVRWVDGGAPQAIRRICRKRRSGRTSRRGISRNNSEALRI